VSELGLAGLTGLWKTAAVGAAAAVVVAAAPVSVAGLG
jgi:hypothetical protein